MKLWQHKKNPDVKFLSKTAEDNPHEVEIWSVRPEPGADYHLASHLWAYSGRFPKAFFLDNYEPVRLDDTDEKTKEFWKEFGPSPSVRSS